MAASWEDVPGLGELMARAYDVREGALDPAAVARRIDELRPYLDELARLAGLRDGETIADVGCGAGSVSLGLAVRVDGARVGGIDVSPKAIEAAVAAADHLEVEARFREGTAGDITEFAPDAALVVAVFIMNLLPEKQHFLGALAETAAEDGRIIVVDAFVDPAIPDTETGEGAPGPLLPATFEQMADEAGLEVTGNVDLTDLVHDLANDGVWPWHEVVRSGLLVLGWRLERQ